MGGPLPSLLLLLLPALLVPCVTMVSGAGPVGWKEIPGVDNFGFDIKTMSTSGGVAALKAACLGLKYCAGFSSAFGTLKFNVSAATLGPQANTVLYVRDPPPPPVPAPPPPTAGWPLPQQYTFGEAAEAQRLLIPADFSFKAAGGSATNAVLDAALSRYRALVVPSAAATSPSSPGGSSLLLLLRGCDVFVENGTAPLSLHMDESYTLDVPAAATAATGGGCRASIRAPTVWGALRGLETFSQLVSFTRDGSQGFVSRVPVAIRDSPRFPYRGLMIDTARHFWPVPLIKQHLDLMAASKLNVLHWHLSDMQGFSFNSTAAPRLSQYGSYDPNKALYSHADLSDVVAYASQRGIRIVAEIDVPAHAFIWAYPGLYPRELQGSLAAPGIDPTSDKAYAFLGGLLAEVASIFPDDELHVGLDEVGLAAWNNSHVLGWMAARNMTNLVEVEAYFLDRLRGIAAGLKPTPKRLTIWHDPVANGAAVAPDVTVEVWGGDLTFLNAVAAKGHDTVWAAPFYLDNVGAQWTDFYGNPFGGVPVVPNGTNAADTSAAAAAAAPAIAASSLFDPHVVGLETCMWSEWVDATNSVQRVWPRAASLAEVAWAKPDGADPGNPLLYQLSAPRLAQWRCRMVRRGLPVEPVGPVGKGPYWCTEGGDAEGWEAHWERAAAGSPGRPGGVRRRPRRGRH